MWFGVNVESFRRARALIRASRARKHTKYPPSNFRARQPELSYDCCLAARLGSTRTGADPSRAAVNYHETFLLWELCEGFRTTGWDKIQLFCCGGCRRHQSFVGRFLMCFFLFCTYYVENRNENGDDDSRRVGVALRMNECDANDHQRNNNEKVLIDCRLMVRWSKLLAIELKSRQLQPRGKQSIVSTLLSGKYGFCMG